MIWQLRLRKKDRELNERERRFKTVTYRRPNYHRIRMGRHEDFPILVASLTHREDKRIFLLCHYFARRKKRINSNPSTSDKTNPANSQAKSRRSHLREQTIREEILAELLTDKGGPWPGS